MRATEGARVQARHLGVGFQHIAEVVVGRAPGQLLGRLQPRGQVARAAHGRVGRPRLQEGPDLLGSAVRAAGGHRTGDVVQRLAGGGQCLLVPGRRRRGYRQSHGLQRAADALGLSQQSEQGRRGRPAELRQKVQGLPGRRERSGRAQGRGAGRDGGLCE
ncbi:hypothetical protein ACFQ0G_09100 [Streptomyces chiangmaiensis]